MNSSDQAVTKNKKYPVAPSHNKASSILTMVGHMGEIIDAGTFFNPYLFVMKDNQMTSTTGQVKHWVVDSIIPGRESMTIDSAKLEDLTTSGVRYMQFC